MIINDFSIRQGEICFLAALTDMTNYLGGNIDEPFILGMSTGLQFRLEHEREEGAFNVDCIHLLRDKSRLDEFFDLIGMRLEEVRVESIQGYLEYLRRELNNKNPILTTVDIYHLDYHLEYGKRHRGHDIIVYGIDEENERAWIADNYITTLKKSTYMGEIPLTSLSKALNLSETCTDYTFLSWVVKKSGLQSNLKQGHIVQKIRESGEIMLKSSERGLMKNGIHGIKELICILEDISQKKPSKETSNMLEELNLMLTGLAGPVSTRKLFSSFLKWAIEVLGVKLDKTIVEEYEELSKAWKISSTILLKAARTENYGYIKRSSNKMKEILSKEEKCARILQSAELCSDKELDGLER